ncbi:hypothetical protein LINPERHAP1_LOCUS36704 [Linum perenne]
MGMVKMVDDRQLENGNFKASGYKDLERWLHTQIPGCKLKEDPHIKSRHHYFKEKFCAQHTPKSEGINNTPLPFWEKLCKIFGQSR